MKNLHSFVLMSIIDCVFDDAFVIDSHSFNMLIFFSMFRKEKICKHMLRS
jgi:hypothetical protein